MMAQKDLEDGSKFYAADYYPNYSPDGTLLCFTSEWDGKAEIYLMNSNGITHQCPTVTDVQTAYLSWRK